MATERGASGTVTVTQCSRGFLVVEWHCQGNFSYTDPMADGPGVTANVVLANDPRRYRHGDQVDVSVVPGTRRGYLWGGSYFLSHVVLALLGVAVCLLTAFLLVAWRGASRWLMAGILAVAIACLSPTLMQVWFPPPAAASSQPGVPAGPPPAIPPSPWPTQTP